MSVPRDEGLDKRLNQVATTLIGATAGVSALFALLGANSERVWLILDDATTKKLLASTTLFVLLAISFGLRALLEKDQTKAGWLLLAGTAAFVTSLAMSVWTAAAGANVFARPAFVDVSVVRSSSEKALLRFTVRATSLDRTQRVGVRVVEQTTGHVLYDATLPPDEKAVGEQKVELLLEPLPPGPLLLAAWHRDVSRYGSSEPRCEQTDRPAGTVPAHATPLADVPDGTACLTLLA